MLYNTQTRPQNPILMFAITKNTSFYFMTVIVLSFICRLFFLAHHELLVEEAYYWNYAAHLDFGYLDHPPLVALLIKLSNTLFGINEFAVRCPAMVCWMITAYYSYKWSELIQPGTGRFAVLLLSILPFFFLYSVVITPDLPLMACWSAALYYLYRALCLRQARSWYAAGLAVGLGLLSKYTIVLLLLATGLYLLSSSQNRRWLGRKEPYLAALIMLLLFSPVIYWNATHDWMSFAFQSTRRFQGKFYFSLHQLLGLLVLFVTPIGLIGLSKLLYRQNSTVIIDKTTRQYIQYYTIIPFMVFAVFSLSRELKWNWIGPGLLALLPWLALLMHQQRTTLKQWLYISPVLLASYTFVFFCISFGQPVFFNQLFFSKMISWEKLTQQYQDIASTLETSGETPIFIPLDTYSIASELAFYQAKYSKAHPEFKPFRIHDASLFGFDGLMFKMWSQFSLHGKTVIFIGKEANSFDNDLMLTAVQSLSPIHQIWGLSQGQHNKVRPYYYKIAKMK
ncbi:MAG: hypothetical protein CK424_08150 [Legionella sp.]|nr:MAG: hypothetical protein CK424_08150 [Legionella sp.]